MLNAKNQVQELLQRRGFPVNWGAMLTTRPFPGGGFVSRLRHELPTGEVLEGEARAPRATAATIAACEDALSRSSLGLDAGLQADAQAGDALIKLTAYALLGEGPSERSRWLQRHESDAHLATVFERWWHAEDAEVRQYGLALGKKARATIVEALIWRRFGPQLLRGAPLGEVLDVLSQE
ncbi:MAG: hypothetical protein EP330_08460 [Deltaproteobacteria bacterium]|nr:MAG: hypothetical protein EP330_08460 [Deltaproteobacteria bacterium]